MGMDWHSLRLEAVENTVSAYLDNRLLTVRECGSGHWQGAGRGAFYSSYDRNLFRKLEIRPVEGKAAVAKRWDDMEDFIQYQGAWNHETIGSFLNYRRTLSVGASGAEMKFSFEGTGFAITGSAEEEGNIRVKLDGRLLEEDLEVIQQRPRGVSYCKYGLEDGRHEVEVQVLCGKYAVDSVEVL